MPPAANRVSIIDALLRLGRHSQRKAETDETSPDAERRAAARYRAVVETPIPIETWLRAECEIHSGTRSVTQPGGYPPQQHPGQPQQGVAPQPPQPPQDPGGAPAMPPWAV